MNARRFALSTTARQAFATGLLAALLVAGCSSDDGEAGADAAAGADTATAPITGDAASGEGSDTVTGGDGTADAATAPTADADGARTFDAAVAPGLPAFDELEEGWTAMQPGGDTVCSRGDPYAFFVRKGRRDRVIVNFEGGGACWDATTCGFSAAIFKERVDLERYDDRTVPGLYDHDDPANPVADHTHVYIPYCTGDIHWGDAETTYGEGDDAFAMRHRGAVNARAALAWVYANIDAPERLLVTGCSAGAYGSVFWAAHLAIRYPAARVVQFADSGAGIITQDFFLKSFPSWNALAAAPQGLAALEPLFEDYSSLDLADLYILLGAALPDVVLSQFNTAFDENQTFYFQAMGGGDQQAWAAQMEAMVAKAAEGAPNFRYFTASGDVHCILHRPSFYEVEADGVRLVDWLRQLLEGPLPESVHCSDCGP